MSQLHEFEFELTDDGIVPGTLDEVTVLDENDDFVRFRMTCWGRNVIAQPMDEDLVEFYLELPHHHYDRKRWVEKFRVEQPINHWARLLQKPTRFAEWFGALRRRQVGSATNTFVIVTNDECGLELGRVEGNFR